MPFDFAWDEIATGIIVETYTGDWSIKDSRAIWLEEERVLASHEGKLDVIIVMNDLHLPLSGMRHFTEVSRSKILNGDRLGLSVLVGLKSSDQPIYDLFIKLYPALSDKIAVAGSMDEARQMIISHRELMRK